MRIDLVSEKFVNNDILHNLNVIERVLKDSKGDLVLFGECFLQGFEGLTWQYIKDKDRAISTKSFTFVKIKNACKKYCRAVGFGYFELKNDKIYSSYAIIDENGELIYNFRRLSVGWKEYTKTDNHYVEGESFEIGTYKGSSFICGLCGDFWHDDILDLAKRYKCDFVIWPCYLDYEKEKWDEFKVEYATRVKDFDCRVLLINSLSNDELNDYPSFGGCLVFNKGKIEQELRSASNGILTVEI